MIAEFTSDLRLQTYGKNLPRLLATPDDLRITHLVIFMNPWALLFLLEVVEARLGIRATMSAICAGGKEGIGCGM